MVRDEDVVCQYELKCPQRGHTGLKEPPPAPSLRPYLSNSGKIGGGAEGATFILFLPFCVCDVRIEKNRAPYSRFIITYLFTFDFLLSDTWWQRFTY